MGANEPWSVANLDPRGMVGRIYVGDHLTLLHTKYLSSEPYGFREDFWSFSHWKSMGANQPQGLANLDPRGMVGRIYVGQSMGANEPWGMGQFGSQGHGWQDVCRWPLIAASY